MSGRNVSDEILGAMGLAIVGGELRPGERFLLSDIEERHGVSRTVARDVVKVLVALGLLTAKRRAGLEVQPMSSWRVLDPMVIRWRLDSDGRSQQIASLTEVRTAIEPRAARLAALNRTEEQAARLVALAQDMHQLGSQGLGRSVAYLQADIAFHSLLLEASGNEMYAAMESMIIDVLRGRSVHGLTPVWPAPEAMAGHVRTAEAVMAQDAEAAGDSSRRMIEVVTGEVTSQRGA